ncbi:MAG: BatA domain-containing protein [Pirellulales bacterium]
MFTFLSPLFLIGLASAAIPLLIHLSRSKRTKKMRFSTTRFFTDQFLRSYRMSQLKELLLLALRMALCALFAMALARPLFLPPGQSLLAGQSRSLVLVIDNSASMGYVEEGQTLLARAQLAARRLLDELRPGDTASVVLAARKAAGPETLFPEPTPALNDVRQAVEQIVPAELGTDLVAAVARAEQILRSSAAKSKEVYVLSDLQTRGWEERDDPSTGEAESRNLYFVVRLRPDQPENLAVTSVNLASARPMVGVPFSIQPHVLNQSQRVRATTVRLFIDDQQVGERRLEELKANRWSVPRFHHAFAAPGWHRGYVEIEDSGLPADDRRYFAFEVLDEVKVLAVDGAPSAVARLDELFFLKNALTASIGGRSSIKLDTVEPAALAQANLDSYPLLILANVESLAAPLVEKLEAYVDGGGRLLFFLGDKVSPAFYNQNLAGTSRLHGGLQPGRLQKIEGSATADTDVAFIGGIDEGHAALSAFGENDLGNLAGVTFKALWRVEPGDARVIMRTGGQESGLPLLLEKDFGKGRVLLFASTCDRDWTNLPVRPVFLPWIYRLVSYMAQQPLAADGFFATGDRVSLPVSAAEGLGQILIKQPDGSLGHAIVTDDPAAPLAYDGAMQSGVYSISDAAKPGQPARLFVANLENHESDLAYLDDLPQSAGDNDNAEKLVEAELKRLLPGRPLVTYVADADRLREASLAARRGFPLWDIVLWIVLAIALFEPWLANRVSLRHYARPVEIAASPIRRAGRASMGVERGPSEQPPAEATAP